VEPAADRPALVIENDPTDDLCRLGDWLTEAGLPLLVVRAHLGEPIPTELDAYCALIVLGGDQNAFPAADGAPGAPWFPQVEALLRKAVRHRVPTLGICLGGQLLAQAHGGLVERSATGPEIGARLIAKRDLANDDLLFGGLPFAPDVLQWHSDEIVELPLGAVLMAASPRYPHQAFRLGDRAWGTQFHLETDVDMMAGWVESSRSWLEENGFQPDGIIAGAEAVQEDMREVWQPFAHRFAQLALGTLPEATYRAGLPLLS
jgi:GMP synthase-like glutamine amidotransferase